MKRKLFLYIIIMMMLGATANSQQNFKFFINVYVIGLDQPIKRIIDLSEISTKEELDSFLQTIEREFLEGEKFGKTPLWSTLDHLVEDLIETQNSFPEDSDVYLIMYTDFVNTDNSRNLFRSAYAIQNSNNLRRLEPYILSRLRERVKKIYPVHVVGSKNESNIYLARRICTPQERVYELNETNLLRNDLLQSFESSIVVLNIILDHSNSMNSIVRQISDDVKENITGVFERSVGNSADDPDGHNLPAFPSDFSGTWRRSQSAYVYTLTFTSNTLKAGNQDYYWGLQRVSGDVYRITVNSSDYNGTLIIRLVDGCLEIDEYEFRTAQHYSVEHDWTGIWERQ